MVCDDVLKIKNWPKELSKGEKEDFLRHFGAIGIKIITSNAKQQSVAFAKFESKEAAKSVMLRLHQIMILNSRLSIEFAQHDVTENHMIQKRNEELVESNNKKNFKLFTTKLNALNNTVSFNQPPPPQLKYIYPKANRATINNIAHALASVPKFYTQVLHLMNRMNLPPPFSDKPDPPKSREHIASQLRKTCEKSLPVQVIQQVQKSSSESEIESDPENANKPLVLPKKRVSQQKKTVKRPKFIKPNVVQSGSSRITEKVEDVFETTDIQLQKKIEVNLSSSSLDERVNRPVENVGSFGLMKDAVKLETSKNEMETTEPESTNSVISEEELAANRIPSNDLSVVSVFKNYHPGSPTCRLYIKNIAKTVDAKDLEYIYNRYRGDNSSDKPSQFDIRLLQEGKMKGQAFITLDSVELAKKALTETNAYILKDKPLIVVFARSAVPKAKTSK